MAEPQRAPTAYPDDLSGITLGRFAVRARLGRGGMGEVYRAEDTRLHRTVALKRIAPAAQSDARYRERFLKEAERASQLTDQRIAGLYDVLEENGELFLVMEYVEGGTLRQRMKQPLSLHEFLDLAIQCAGALQAAHARGIVHCDIKPENIMLTPEGQVKILDFGLAKRLPHRDEMQSTAADTSSFSGTPAYMAPEALLEKPLDGRADIFSLGVVFYEMLAGRHPFLGENFVASLDRILRSEPEPLRRHQSALPAELERIVDRMLAKEPQGRYPDAAALTADLERLRQGHAPLRLLPSTRRARRRLQRATLAVVPVALVAALALFAPWKQWVGLAPVLQPRHIAVLPFQVPDQSEDSSFALGLSETLTARLTQLSDRYPLQVLSAAEFTNRTGDPAERARELGASLLVEGSLRRSGDLLRMSFALVDARSRRQLRAGVLTLEATDPFQIEDRIVEAVLAGLDVELAPADRQLLVAQRTTQPEAQDFYLRGRGYLQEYGDPQKVESAIELFQRALQRDSSYALAHAGLGEAYWKKWEATSDTHWAALAQQSCQQAQRLDARSGAAYACLGTIYRGTGRYEEAREAFRQALDHDPTNDDLYRGLAATQERLGDLDQAEKTFQRAIAARPHYWASYNWLGGFYYRRGRLPEATAMFRQVVALAPDNPRGHTNLGAVYIAQGRYADAVPVFKRSLELRPSYAAHTNLGAAYFYLRRLQDSVRHYEAAVQLSEKDHIALANLAEAYYFLPQRRRDMQETYRKAIALAAEKLAVNPRDAYTLGALAQYHAMVGDFDAARRHLQRALEAGPADADVLFDAALVHHLAGEREEALRALEQAVAAGYSRDRIRDHPLFEALRSEARFRVLSGK